VSAPERFLRVWFADDSHEWVGEEDLPRIDALVSQHVDSGGTRDALIHMTGTQGDPITCRVSYIVGWSLTTPEGRQRAWEIEAHRREEKARQMAEVGLFEDE
jgi:hypothetical protein